MAMKTDKPLRVLLIDDHSLFRAGLAELLSRRDIEVCASVNDGDEGLALIAEKRPDVVLLDIRMPGSGGLEILKRLREIDKTTAVIMVTTSREEKDVSLALRVGANGYLLKDMEPEKLIEALYKIREGETVVAPELAATLARVVRGEPTAQSGRLSALTPREHEILLYIADGGSNKAIARQLGISDGTVKLHVKSILRKLDVHSRVEAAVIAVEHGLNSTD